MLEKEKAQLKAKYKEELFRDISKVEGKIREIIRKLQEESLTMKDAQSLQEELRNLRKELTIEEKRESENLTYIPHIGDRVLLRSTKKEGYVIDVDNEKKTALVQVGLLKINVPWAELAPSLKEEISVPSYVKVERVNQEDVPREISIRMMTVDEGLEEVKKYLEKAFLAGLKRVRIVHGKGTGKLRNAVHEYLSKVPYVKEYYLAPPNEGGEGATIVILDSPV